MNDLRLIPAAITLWLCAAAVILTRNALAGLLTALLCAGLLPLWDRRQAVLSLIFGWCITLLTWVKVRAADEFDFNARVQAQVVTTPQQGEHSWFFRARVPGFPSDIPVLSREPPPVGQFDTVTLYGQARPSSGLGGVLFIAQDVELLAAPGGYQAWVRGLKDHFRQAVIEHSSGEAAGLIPAMTLGDTSLQTLGDRERYALTGLAHLSAVSGGNVAMITTAVLSICLLLRCHRSVAICAAFASLVLFVVVVGLEPSVMRAGVMGSLGLVAMLTHTRAPPAHALSLAIIIVITLDPAMATSLGLSLSAFATAGIIAAYPLLYRAIASEHWPDALSRAVAIALSAELATLPLVVVMSNRVSTTSVLANVLVAPVVPLITVLGMAAVILSGTIIGGWLVWAITPLCNWIALVSRACSRGARIDIASDPISIAWVVLASAWLVWALACRRPTPLITVCSLILAAAWFAA
ncbi:ComEC/Rec2 family competence protein [Corynebacterium gerontici]|uniref:ComEC family competence protein n=1 Tax=Corynebacterium gerontici TaxID=2079234 RepID=A0A3G6J648_9CORY|nr:ComEC/Rec2 family competence protein [Corynebacterium gerontici]AZA11930.1 ComEC family competence protein [Corynebacterium gerontici]